MAGKHRNVPHEFVTQHSNTCKRCGNFLISRWHMMPKVSREETRLRGWHLGRDGKMHHNQCWKCGRIKNGVCRWS